MPTFTKSEPYNTDLINIEGLLVYNNIIWIRDKKYSCVIKINSINHLGLHHNNLLIRTNSFEYIIGIPYWACEDKFGCKIPNKYEELKELIYKNYVFIKEAMEK